MTSESGIEIRTSPDRENRNYMYLEQGWISVEAHNSMNHDIILERISCTFEELETLKTSFSANFSELIRPNEWSRPLTVPFDVRLSLNESSNFYKVGLRYRNAPLSVTSQPAESLLDSRTYIIVNRVPERPLTLFISHKASEDTPLARKLSGILTKLGLRAYIAEDDPRPSLKNYWKDKIFPAIEKSVGVIAIWTENAEKDSTNIRKEVDHAREVGRETYPLVAEDSNPGDFFPRNSVEHISFDPDSPIQSMSKLALCIQRDIQSGQLNGI